jgi:hypothetical protein
VEISWDFGGNDEEEDEDEGPQDYSDSIKLSYCQWGEWRIMLAG